MKTILCAFAALLLSIPQAAFAQATLASTTLSAAVTDTNIQTFKVASATGIVAGSTSLFVDAEFAPVEAVNGTFITVQRGGSGTPASTHASGATVYLGPNSYFSAFDRFGSCTSGNEVVLPVINVKNAKGFQCTGSQWLPIFQGTMNTFNAGTQPSEIRAFCTGTAGSAETEFLNGAACSGATTATARYVMASAGTLANLRVTLSAAGAGGTGKDLLTVKKNGSDTALTVTTGTTACATGVAAACIDTAHSVAVAAGDVITFSFVSATSDTAANVSAVVQKY